MKLSVEIFKDFIESVEAFVAPRPLNAPSPFDPLYYSNDNRMYFLSYRPKDRLLNLALEMKDENLLKFVSSVYLQDTPQLHWIYGQYLYVQISASNRPIFNQILGSIFHALIPQKETRLLENFVNFDFWFIKC